MCYIRSMSATKPVKSADESPRGVIPVRTLRNDVSEILRRVEAGESFIITVRGRPVAQITRVAEGPTFLPWAEVEKLLENSLADRGLLDELREMMPETTDDLPL